MACPGHGHVQGIEFFPGPGHLLGLQCQHRAGRRVLFRHQKHKFFRGSVFSWPIDQHGHAVGIALQRVGVQQQHSISFQAFCAVNGQQPHRIGLRGDGRQHAARLERAHQTIGRGVTPATQAQCHAQQRPQIGQHVKALGRGRGGGETGQHVTMVINSLQGVVRRQVVQPTLVLQQTSRQSFQ